MRYVKRLLAVVLTLALVLSFAACHGKNETAVKVGDTEFSSAFYMCCLINSDMEAKDKIDAAKSEEAAETEVAQDETMTETDYYSEKIDDVDFVAWVENNAVNMCKQFAYYIDKCKELGIEVTDEDFAQYDNMSDYYWNYYGYNTLFEPNGVGLETYKKFNRMSAYEEKYFESVYGKDGSSPISEEEIDTSFNEQYSAVYSIVESTSSLEEDAVNELKAKFDGFKARLDKGAKWEDIYVEYKGEPLTAQDGGPADPYLTVVGDEKTSYHDEIWETVKDMKTGETAVASDGDCITLVKKADINSDPFFRTELDSSIRYSLKYEDFTNECKEAAKGLDAKVVKRAVKIFKVKKIIYPRNAQ